MRRALLIALLLTGCGGADFEAPPLFGEPAGGAAGSGSSADTDAGTGGSAGTPQGGSAGSDAAAGGSAGSAPDGGPETGTGGAAGAAGAGAAGAAGTGGAPTCFTIDVQSATWGANCGATTPLQSVTTQCEGKNNCTYTMNVDQDPGFDPASGCWKDIDVDYNCMGSSGVAAQKQAHVEMTWTGTHVLLECCPP